MSKAKGLIGKTLKLFGRKPAGGAEQRFWGITSVNDLIAPRVGTAPNARPPISANRAMQHSAVWASLRLRADLLSTLPVDAYRDVRVDGTTMQLEVPKSPVLIAPGGERIGWGEWIYMSQVELDRSGNAIGLISKVDGLGLPKQIDLCPSSAVDVIVRAGQLAAYRIYGTEYPPEQVWHERQYSLAGLHVGLSPVAYAAATLGEYVSVQDFVTNWFTSGAVPRARLKNTEKELDPKDALIVKEAWRAAVSMNEPFVHGSDWEYNLLQAEKVSTDWLEAKKFSAVDIARFFGVPADLIDASVSGQAVTYANITQRNLQFLIMNLGPAIIRRECALSNGLLSRPRYIKFNSDALLRMDPMTRSEMLAGQISSRQLAPSEARALENREPFTESQKAEFDRFWPPKAQAPTAPTGVPQQ